MTLLFKEISENPCGISLFFNDKSRFCRYACRINCRNDEAKSAPSGRRA